jgi:hypothetical protein
MADTKISDLPEATTLDGLETALMSQASADAIATLQRIRDDLDWVRPADWTAMPSAAANTARVRFAINDNAGQVAAIRATVSSGTYSVDWGDGTSTSGVASGVTAEHTYSYADGDIGSATSRGYKTAIATVTPDSGNLTILNLSLAPSGYAANLPTLEVQIQAASMTTVNTLGASRYLEYVNIVAIGTVTAVSFDAASGLVKIDEPGTLLTNITSMQNCFRGCSSLRRINLAGLGTGITTMQQAFQNCSSLTELVFPSGTLGASLTNLTQTFNNCSRLASFTLPSGAFSGVTSAASAFSGCSSLRSIVFPSGAFASTTNMNAFISNCFALRYVEFAGALTAVTDIGAMFSANAILAHIKFTTGSFASLSSATTNLFNGCAQLGRVENLELPLTFTVASCRLSAAALDEIYTSLRTITSQTVTVTSNFGTSGDTPSIATGKGWTVTGS